MQILHADGCSSYMVDESRYTQEEKDGRVVLKLKPGNECRNRPLVISLLMTQSPKLMYRLFSDDFIDHEEILGVV